MANVAMIKIKNIQHSLSSHQPQQRGVALITAVLIVALVTVVAAAMATRQVLDIRRTENIIHSVGFF